VKTKMNLMLMLVLACSMSAMAQTDTSSDSSMKKDSMSGKSMSMTGCIAEKDGKYMMMNKEHPDGVQLMSSEDMKAHVGHKMKVTGTMSKMDAMSGDAMKSDDSMKKDDSMAKDDNMKHDDMSKMGMKVSSMKMMSDQCDMSKMMNK
jgi:hypothetical protein